MRGNTGILFIAILLGAIVVGVFMAYSTPTIIANLPSGYTGNCTNTTNLIVNSGILIGCS